MQITPKWVHIIGICGVVTSGLAVMFKYKGSKVTGSDKGFFPPVSDYLKKYDIPIAIGYRKERLTDEDGNHPDLVIVQGLKGDNNEEYKEALRLNLTTKNFPQILSEHVVVDNSIVVAGTYGKTTITSVLADIFRKNKTEISYMYGGINLQMEESILGKTDRTQYSIVEGDEYLTSLADKTSKFFYYKAKYLVINSCKWEHPDLFRSEEEYVENFRKLVETIPTDGLIVANANDANVIRAVEHALCKVIYYSVDKEKAFTTPHWFLEKTSKPLPTFVKLNPQTASLEIIPYERKIIGEFNEENLLAATAMAYELGVRKERIQEAIADFAGIKRRLEIKYNNDKLSIIDDFGSSPPKAQGSLKALRQDYPESEIFLIFEPNTGNRTSTSIPTYRNALDMADEIIFPRFTQLPRTDIERFSAEELAEKLKPLYKNITVVPDDEILFKLIIKQVELGSDRHKIVVFMGSHSFRGIIDKLCSYFSMEFK